MNHSTSKSPPVTWLQPGEIPNIYKLVKICVTSQTRCSYSVAHILLDQYRPIWCIRTNGIKYVICERASS
jgi:hypothetical protein